MTVIVSVLILAATVLLFSEKELASKWGVSILEEGGLVQRTAEEERAAERVEEFSRTYRLSPREQEVLTLLAEGKTGRVILPGAVYRRGYVQGPTRATLREDGHQLPAKGSCSSCWAFVRKQLQVAADWDCAGCRWPGCAGCRSRGFFGEGRKTR